MTERRALVVHGHREGNAVGGRERISAECRARVQTAETAAVRHQIKDVLFSGLGRQGCASEARQMLEVWKVPGRRIFLDEVSADSAENAIAAITWARRIGASELLVVSSWWHLRLPAYYRSAGAGRPIVRYEPTRRCDRLPAHLLHELRYLPRALRVLLGSEIPTIAPPARPFHD